MSTSQPEATDQSYTRMTADVYDAIYLNQTKDYQAEAAKLKELIASHKKSAGRQLLDVACGTGLHLPYLKNDFELTGVDLAEQQLVAARKRLPGVHFEQGDMRDFNLGRQFDVVMCLFSSIGYIHTQPELNQTIANFAKHTADGGVVIIEPWIRRSVFDPNRAPHQDVGQSPDGSLKVTRTAHTSIDGNLSVMKMHHVVERPEGVSEFTEEHKLAMYEPEDFEQAFTQAGLSFELDPDGISGRGLYIGVKPLA